MRTRPFLQVDVFSSGPYSGNPVAVVLDADDVDNDDDAAPRQLDEPVRDHVRASAHDRGRRLSGAHLHARHRAAVRRPSDAWNVSRVAATRRWHARSRAIVQECARGSSRFAATQSDWPSPLPRSFAPVLRTIHWSTSWRLPCRSAETTSWRRSGWTTDRAGSRCSCRTPRRCSPSARPGGLGHRAGRRLPAGFAGVAIEVRAFFPKDGVLGRGSGHRQPQRVPRRMARGTGRITAPYVASQGTVLGRAGRVYVDGGRRRAGLGRRRHHHRDHRDRRSLSTRSWQPTR